MSTDRKSSSSSSTHRGHNKDSSSKTNEQKSAKTFEELFDSGYNSNLQSKTFLDSDNEEFDYYSTQPSSTNITNEATKKHGNFDFEQNQSKNSKNNSKIDSVQQWSDSGVCITDSGLSIQEDYDNYDNNDNHNNTQIDSKQSSNKIPAIKENDDNELSFSHELSTNENNNNNNNELELWLKHNCDGEALLHLAIIEGLEDVACSILRNISSSNEMLNSYNYLYQNPLHLAILKQQTNVIPLLIAKGCSLTFQDNMGNTPLHIACKYSLINIVQLIIETASNKMISKCIEIRNYNGDTCLHLAAYNQDLKLIELLIRSGANIDINEGKSGKTILHIAIENLNVQMVNFLLKNNADIQAETFAGRTPLCFLLKSSINYKQQQQQQDSLSLSSTTTTMQQQLNKAKLFKIIRLCIEYCNERKISLDSIHAKYASDYDNDETSDDES